MQLTLTMRIFNLSINISLPSIVQLLLTIHKFTVCITIFVYQVCNTFSQYKDFIICILRFLQGKVQNKKLQFVHLSFVFY